MAGVVGAVASIGIGLAPGSIPAIGIACFGILGVGLGTINTLIFALQADTVEYGEWNSGVRAEGGRLRILSFTRKAGQGVGGALAAYTIGLGGYVSGAPTQTDDAVASIKVAAGFLPSAVFLGAAAVMLAYPLTEQAFRKLVAEVAERRARGRAYSDLMPDADAAILIAYDGSEPARNAIEHAGRLFPVAPAVVATVWTSMREALRAARAALP